MSQDIQDRGGHQRATTTAVVYARARVTGQADTNAREAQSAHQQLKRCEEEAVRLGVSVVHEYIDLRSSANDRARPGLIALLKRVQTQGDVNYVIVGALDCLTRTVQGEVALVQAFEAGGAQLVIAGHGIHRLNAAAEAVQATQLVFKELKHRELSESARRGWVTRRANARRRRKQPRAG
jgi:hypothetical protein